jgi:hypothetical protein
MDGWREGWMDGGRAREIEERAEGDGEEEGEGGGERIAGGRGGGEEGGGEGERKEGKGTERRGRWREREKKWPDSGSRRHETWVSSWGWSGGIIYIYIIIIYIQLMKTSRDVGKRLGLERRKDAARHEWWRRWLNEPSRGVIYMYNYM